MNLTARDRKIVMGLIPVVILLAYWFLLLSPKREAAAAAGETLAAEQQRLADASGRATTLSAAESNFARDYAAVVRLGKAVPDSVDMPSLLVQLEQAAKGTGIEFLSVSAGERTTLAESSSPAAGAATGGAPAPGAPAPGGAAATPGTAPSGQPPASAPGQAAATATDAANTASTPPATADQTGATPAAGQPPTQGALETVPLDFSFRGSFFELANLFHRLKRFVYVSGDKVHVRGRLMTIDSVQYATDPTTFPTLTAQVKATVFLTPKAEGAAAGATTAGPAPAPAAPAPSTSTASTGGSAAPAPTATATP